MEKIKKTLIFTGCLMMKNKVFIRFISFGYNFKNFYKKVKDEII
jgi:hypothetical protein